MTDPGTLPSENPWAIYAPILSGLVRTVLGILGGVGMTWAMTVSASQIQMGVSAVLMLAAALWSAWQKIDAARKSHASSVSSAANSAAATMAQGAPVAVVVGTKPAV